MIQLQNLSKSYGLQELLRNVTLQVNARERVGITGRNGTGKTTLFRLLTGEESPDSGQILIPKGYTLGYLKQILQFSLPTVLAEAVSALKPHEDGFTEGHRAEAVLFGLGFSREDMQRPPAMLSGGFQIRLNLAKVLLGEPNMLLLDEPTNYLDIVSVRWIERFLRDWSGELLLITHDRNFMNRVCSHTVALHRHQMRKIQGPVEKLWETIFADEEVQLRTQENDARKREQLEKFITRFRAQASKASAVQSKVKALERQGAAVSWAATPRDLDFCFTPAPFPGKRVLQAQGLSFRWKDSLPWLLQDLSFEVFKGDRIAVIGPNGRGKTTLLNLIAQELSPVEGSVQHNPNVQLAYFGQTNIQRLDLDKTVEEEIQSAVRDAVRGRARSLAGLMMFEGDAALKPIKVLSGGERSRVLLAKILAQPCNLLLLDEPTNHLDMESVDSLVEAVDGFEGAVMFVTHDEGLLHSLATRLIVFDGGRAFLFEGRYAEFLERVGWMEEKDNAPTTHITGQSIAKPTLNDRSKEARRARAEYVAERARTLKPLEQRVAKAEKAVAHHEAEIKRLEEELALASTAADGAQITELAKQLNENQTALESAFQDWESATAELEAMQEKYPADG
ncbi:MAG TPA: ABC-F family ATP-binding cassette domain-containing protein [Fibrobacteraceae bacterium]|nr:ABC-F family ATP-binding cassette domain-containing protein [Fibrobacteraceae bacterium]